MAASTQESSPQEAAETESTNPLSEREMDVARHLVTGATNTQIAKELTISPNTVKVHLRNIYEKLEVTSRTEASTHLLQRGWISVPGLDVPEATETSEAVAGEAPAETTAMPAAAARSSAESPAQSTAVDPAADPAATAISLPAPDPLADRPAMPALWQQLFLVLVLCGCAVALFLPNVFSLAQPQFDLLSDNQADLRGAPVVLMEQRWDAQASMPQGRSRMASAQIDDTIYIIGGESHNGVVLDSVEIFNITLNRWQSGTPLPHPLSNAAAAAFGGRIYVAGGSVPALDDAQNLVVSDELWVYDPADDSWQQPGLLPNPLAGTAMVASQGSLFLVGGWDGEAMRDELWSWDLSAGDGAGNGDSAGNSTGDAAGEVLTPRWTLESRMDVPRSFLGAAMLDGTMYVVGGFDGQRELALASAYTPATNTWQTLPSLTVARGGLSVLSDGTAIYALGGGWTRSIDTHERFNPDAEVWSNIVSPISGEWRHLSAASYQGSLHILGGWGGDYLDTQLRYESSLRSFLLPLIRTD